MSILANYFKSRACIWTLKLCHGKHGHLEKLRHTSIHISHANELTLCRLPCAVQIVTYARYSSLKSVLNSKGFSSTCCNFKSNRKTTEHSNAAEVDDGDEDVIIDSEVDELFQQFVPSAIGDGDHRVFIVHPDVKWGSKKQYLTTGEQRKKIFF